MIDDATKNLLKRIANALEKIADSAGWGVGIVLAILILKACK